MGGGKCSFKIRGEQARVKGRTTPWWEGLTGQKIGSLKVGWRSLPPFELAEDGTDRLKGTTSNVTFIRGRIGQIEINISCW